MVDVHVDILLESQVERHTIGEGGVAGVGKAR
jgi:hypothetical protein